ncbi:hypothetical protein D3C87_1756540 [compost metagenome]
MHGFSQPVRDVAVHCQESGRRARRDGAVSIKHVHRKLRQDYLQEALLQVRSPFLSRYRQAGRLLSSGYSAADVSVLEAAARSSPSTSR